MNSLRTVWPDTRNGATATVDSVDLISGRVALVYGLNGTAGNYGVKATADRLFVVFPRSKIARRATSAMNSWNHKIFPIGESRPAANKL